MTKMNLIDLIKEGASAFEEAGLYFGHGTDNAFDEALYLALFNLKWPYDISDKALAAKKINLSEIHAIKKLFQERIASKKPAGYLTHEAFFGFLPFYVDERVLIPRSPLIELIEKKFSPWINLNHPKKPRILDLGTGSGCIAIACALNILNASVVASDISEAALEVAKINRARYQLEERIELIHSDLFENITRPLFDVIISNPPYVDHEDMNNLPAEYQHEPQLALAGGTDGLDLIREILKKAKHYLSPNGIIIVEVGNSAEALKKAYPALNFTWLEFETGEAEIFLLDSDSLQLV